MAIILNQSQPNEEKPQSCVYCWFTKNSQALLLNIQVFPMKVVKMAISILQLNCNLTDTKR